MNVEDAYNELVSLKNSWKKRNLPADDAFIALASMLARFALANNTPIATTCKHVCEMIQLLYEDLCSHGERPN